MTDRDPDDSPVPGPLSHGRRLRYQRLDPGVEFARVANFTDAIYAIALTLIAVELRPPVLGALEDDPSALLHGLGEMADEIIIFFVTFAVMGAYWLANHRFVAGLRGVDSAYVLCTLPYLALVAFLPFPAAMMGRYGGNPVAVSVFAVTMAGVSLFECGLLWRAHVGDLFLRPLTADGFRWALMGSLAPVAWFLLSIPVLFVDTLLGMLVWALNIPFGIYLGRRMPEPES